MNIKKLSTDHKDIDVNTGRIILPSAEYLEQINSYVSKSELHNNAVTPPPTSILPAQEPTHHTARQANLHATARQANLHATARQANLQATARQPTFHTARQPAIGNEANLNMSSNRDFVPVPIPGITSPSNDLSPKGWLLTPLMLTGICVCFFTLLLGACYLFLVNENFQFRESPQTSGVSEQRDALLFESLLKENSALKSDLATIKAGVDNIDKMQKEQAIQTSALSKAVDMIEAELFVYEDEDGNVIPKSEVGPRRNLIIE